MLRIMCRIRAHAITIARICDVLLTYGRLAWLEESAILSTH